MDTTKTLPINMENMKRIFDNPDLHILVGSFLLQKAFTEMMQDKVDSVYEQILIDIPIFDDTCIRFKDSERLKNHPRTRIYNHHHMYLSEDELTCNKIYDEADKRLKALGIKPESMGRDYCPALVAESDLMDLEHRIIELTGNPFGVTVNNLLYGGMEKYDKWIDLVIGAVVNHPKFVTPKVEDYQEFKK